HQPHYGRQQHNHQRGPIRDALGPDQPGRSPGDQSDASEPDREAAGDHHGPRAAPGVHAAGPVGIAGNAPVAAGCPGEGRRAEPTDPVAVSPAAARAPACRAPAAAAQGHTAAGAASAVAAAATAEGDAATGAATAVAASAEESATGAAAPATAAATKEPAPATGTAAGAAAPA